MPNTKTVSQFAVRIESIGKAAQQAQKDAVMRASMIVKNSIEGELVRDIGSDQRLRNLKKKSGAEGARLTLGFNIKGTNNPTSLLLARGPWGMVEYNIGPHKITPKVARTGTGKGMSRAQRQRVIRQRELDIAFGASGVFAGKSPLPFKGTFRYSVMHPGTKGKKPFHRGLESSKERAIRELRVVVTGRVATVIRSGRQTYAYIQGEQSTGAYTPASMMG